MGQINLNRTQFKGWSTVTTPANSSIQEIDFVGYFNQGDSVTVVEIDACGNVMSTIASGVIVSAIDAANHQLFLDTSVDTTGLVGTPMIVADSIDDGQAAIDRLYKKKWESSEVGFVVEEPIQAQALNAPIAGQTTFYIDDASFFRAGDLITVLADEGVVDASATILSIDYNADAVNHRAAIVIDEVVDTSTFTNPYMLSLNVTVEDALKRLQNEIDQIDQPIENVYLQTGDCLSAFKAPTLFVEGTSKVYLDGVRKTLGTAGTRATLVQGADASALTLTSMILGIDGNKTKVAVVAGSGIVVTVSGSYTMGYTVSVTDNGGAATSQEIADAINAHATASRVVQAQYGGDGTGVVTPFAATLLAGGLNDGTGDYAEIEQVYNNFIVSTGFKFFAFHIRPSERNRMNRVPCDDEELIMDYREAMSNVN